jgi:hypothetical protein
MNQTVRFLKDTSTNKHGAFGRGEVAAFAPDVAAQLVSRGEAAYIEASKPKAKHKAVDQDEVVDDGPPVEKFKKSKTAKP